MITNGYNIQNAQGNNIPYTAIKNVVPENINEKLPENIQNMDAKQVAMNNGAVASVMKMDKKTLIPTLGIYFPFVFLRGINDNPKSVFTFAGDYEKTFFGKLAKLGDKTSGLIKKIIPGDLEDKIVDGAKKGGNWLKNHSSIARSMTNSPLKYESRMALDQANGIFGRIMGDNAEMFNKGFKASSLDELLGLFKDSGGVGGKFLDFLKTKGIDGAANVEEGVEILTNSLRELGQMPVGDNVTKEIVKDFAEKLSSSNKNIIIDKWAGFFPIGKIPIIGKFFTLKVPMSEIANKAKMSAGLETKLATGGAIGTTVLGKAFPSTFAKLYEGITSDVVGGKIAPIMQAFFIANSIKKAHEAPKGKKVATFADEMTGSVTYLMTAPLAAKLFAHLGGIKYLGMDKNLTGEAFKHLNNAQKQTEAVSMFREAVKALNEKITNGAITRGEYVKEAEKIKTMLKGQTKFWQKPLKLIGRLLGSHYKNETIQPFLEAAPAGSSGIKAFGVDMANKFRNFLYGLKTGKCMGLTPGGILRFALVLLVVSPIVSKPLRKIVHKIFGKPYDPSKEKAEAEKKAKEEAIKNNPFNNLSEEEFYNLLMKNQSRVAELQNNPALAQELQTNPQKFYDYLKEGEAIYDNAAKNAPKSDLLQKYLQNSTMQRQNQGYQPAGQMTQGYQPEGQMTQGHQGMQMNSPMNQQMKMPKPNVEENGSKFNEPKRTYIPSSAPVQIDTAKTMQNNAKFNSIIADMDKTEQEFRKYL